VRGIDDVLLEPAGRLGVGEDEDLRASSAGRSLASARV
jgi:hypothetical protein